MTETNAHHEPTAYQTAVLELNRDIREFRRCAPYPRVPEWHSRTDKPELPSILRQPSSQQLSILEFDRTLHHGSG